MKKKRWTPVKVVAAAVKWVFLIAMCVFTLYPVFYAVIGSFKTNAELTLGNSLFPEAWHYENYLYAFEKLDFGLYTLNSVVLALLTVVLSVVTASMAGYVIGRREFIGKKLLSALYLGSMFISVGSVALYPLYKLLNSWGLSSNLMGLALILTGGQVSNIFLIAGFARSVPKELDDAATIDGAGVFRIYWQIIVPMIRPILGIVALFSYRTAWNEFITAQVFTMSNPNLKTLSVAVANLRYSSNAAAEWHIMAAGASIALIPILIVYLLANKQFIAGITAGAVKG